MDSKQMRDIRVIVNLRHKDFSVQATVEPQGTRVYSATGIGDDNVDLLRAILQRIETTYPGGGSITLTVDEDGRQIVGVG